MQKKIDNFYLKEDEELLDDLNSVKGTTVDEKGLIKKIQAKALLRNRYSLERSSKQSQRLSIIIIIFMVVQIVIALWSYIVPYIQRIF